MERNNLANMVGFVYDLLTLIRPPWCEKVKHDTATWALVELTKTCTVQL